jgi:hypothetical protein
LFKDRVDQKIWMNKRWRMYWITNHFYGRTPSLRGRCVCVADLIVMLWLDLSFDCVVIEQFYVRGMGMELYLVIDVSIVWEDWCHCLRIRFTLIPARRDTYVKAMCWLFVVGVILNLC